MTYMRSKGLRRLLVCAAVVMAVLALAPCAWADTQTYAIQVADLVDLPQDCGNGTRYNCLPGSQPGFQFTDVLPEGSTVSSVTVELNQAVQCAPTAYTLELEFNGQPAGSYTSDAWCSCIPRRDIHAAALPPEAYKARSVNTLLLTNASSCQGLGPDSDLGHAYALVTVEYVPGTSGGGGEGGGGECDLKPVLDRIDALEAWIDEADYATLADMTAEHAATRATVVEGHEETQGWVTVENEATRARVEAQHAETREYLAERMLGYFIERELAESGGSANDMAASACLPEEFGGRLELTISIVFETIEAHALAGCNVSVANTNLDRGHDALADGRFTKACDWYAKAYTAAGSACP
jgi:hypothetical protein